MRFELEIAVKWFDFDLRRCENGSTHVAIIGPLPLAIYFFDKSLDTDNVDIGNDADDNTYCESAVFYKTKKDLIKTTVVICEKKKWFTIVTRNGKIVWKHGPNWPFYAVMLRTKLY